MIQDSTVLQDRKVRGEEREGQIESGMDLQIEREREGHTEKGKEERGKEGAR